MNAANPGDLVLIGPGTYREAVEVSKPGLVLRGTDRNAVVIDAGFESENVIDVYADGVAVENLTVMNGTANGVYWSGITGFRASYVTAIDNGDYGIYAFDSSDGIFEHSYASGSPDSGFYIGQCDPCQAVIDDVLAEWNGLGYSGTNASGRAVHHQFRLEVQHGGGGPQHPRLRAAASFHGVTIAGTSSTTTTTARRR